jgi:hypothetical protein
LILPGIDDYPIHLLLYNYSDLIGKTTGNSTGFLYHDVYGNKWLITARHNIYPSSPDINRFPPNTGYWETPILKLAVHFRINQSRPDRYVLTRKELINYGRISKHPELDIAAINLSDSLTKDPLHQKYYPKKSFFTKENLGNIGDCNIGNVVRVTGFSDAVDSSQDTTLEKYSGKIKAMEEEDAAADPYGRFMFAVDVPCPPGISGSPVILNTGNNTNRLVLLGSYSGNNTANNMSLVTYSTLIDYVTTHGVNLHEKEWRSR